MLYTLHAHLWLDIMLKIKVELKKTINFNECYFYSWIFHLKLDVMLCWNKLVQLVIFTEKRVCVFSSTKGELQNVKTHKTIFLLLFCEALCLLHYIRNINTRESRGTNIVRVCVDAGGGGLALCQRQPERLLGSAGGVGVRGGLFLCEDHCHNLDKPFSRSHVDWHMVDPPPMCSCNQKMPSFRDLHSPSSKRD